jgi:hypothetical protein
MDIYKREVEEKVLGVVWKREGEGGSLLFSSLVCASALALVGVCVSSTGVTLLLLSLSSLSFSLKKMTMRGKQG